MPRLPIEIRDRPVLSVNWNALGFNKHLGAIMEKWPKVMIAVENGRPVLAPSDHGWAVTYEQRSLAGVIIAPLARLALKEAGIKKESRWVMVWDQAGKRMVGHKPEEAPPETASFELVERKELLELRTLAEIGRQHLTAASD